MSYAKLGTSCQTSLAVLTDSTKFYPLDNPDYKLMYSKMFLYPAHNKPNQQANESYESYSSMPRLPGSSTNSACASSYPQVCNSCRKNKF